MTDDTIAAISTAPGEGGIGIVRLSGEKAAEILGSIFVPPGTDKPAVKVLIDKTMYYGKIVEPSSLETIDEALVVLMRGPKSYTGEDVCEIQCHGGNVPLKRILDLVIKLGATPAQPGEFTKRAFLNGRIDLLQAGAVIDLIKSKTNRGYHAAKEQTEGHLSDAIRGIREKLLNALAEIAAMIDYPDEFETEAVRGGSDPLILLLSNTEAEINELLKGAETGRLLRDGLRVAITGKPNTGKSSLFNAMSREDAAIVTSVPGTTRDALEIWLDIRGFPVLLSDTAGIRESGEEIEMLGIRRAIEQYDKADVSILLFDGSRALSEEDEMIAKSLNAEKQHIIAISKSDLPQVVEKSEVLGILPFPYEVKEVLQLSLIGDETQENGKKRAGIEALENLLEKRFFKGGSAGSNLLVTKAWQKVMLENVREEISEAISGLNNGEAPEFCEVSIRAAWNILGEMTGERASDEIIDRVFSDFCVGK